MSEYIVKKDGDTFTKVGELVRCKDCQLRQPDEQPGCLYCTFWKRTVPYCGHCYLGAKGAKDGNRT